VIPAGEEGLQIGRLSLEALRIPLEFVETFKRWGIHTCADFAPSRSRHCGAARTGRAPLWRLARGADDQPLIAKEFPSNFEEHMDWTLRWNCWSHCFRSESASRTAVRAAAYAHSRHRRDQSYAHAGTQRLTHEGTNFSHSDDSAPVPARDSKLLLKLLQLDLEKHPPSLPVTVVSHVGDSREATHAAARAVPAALSRSGRLEVTLARIQNTVEKNAWVCPCSLIRTVPMRFSRAFCFAGNEREALTHGKTTNRGNANLPTSASGDRGVSGRKSGVSRL